MATVCTTSRKRKKSSKYPSGRAYQVRWRLGGRETKLHDGGTLPKRHLAVARENMIWAEIGAGRDPQLALDALKNTTVVERLGLLAGYEKYMASRRDVGTAAQRIYGNSRDAFVPLLGEFTDPHKLVVDEVQEAVNELERTLSPETVRKYVGVLGQVLAYLDVEPNPAKSDKLKRTQGETEEYQPATLAEFEAALPHINEPVRLLFELVECLGLRINEALSLQRGDIDFAEGRLRVSKARTKTRAGQRWLPVPGELLDRIATRVGEGAAHDRRVFGGLTDAHARRALTQACKSAGVRHLKPHGFRHRRISLWVGPLLQFDPVRVRYWAGHATASMSLDLYGHIVTGDDRWRGFWLGEYNKAQKGVAA